MRKRSLLILALGAAVSASAIHTVTLTAQTTTLAKDGTGASAAANPFFSESPLPFQAPQFNLIKDADYQPAIEEGMKRQLAEIDAIANSSDAPTFANTIVAMERSGDLLTRVSKVFFGLTQADTNDTIQKIEETESPRLAAHQDKIYLNPKLFARVKAVYDRRDTLGLDAESKYLVERYYRNFVRSGALLSDADKTKLRALNEEEANLTTQFKSKVLADTNAAGVVVDDKAQLEGLSDGDIAAAAELAKERGMPGKYIIRITNTTRQPIVISMKNRELRERVLKASSERGIHGGPNDTQAIVTRLAQMRADKAKLLGFNTYAAYSLDDQMAKNPQAAEKLLRDLVPAATARARSEAAQLQKVADAEGGGFKIGPADWEYYAEKVRKAQYDLDESQVKPYFLLDRVLQDGVFFAANRLYGLTFKERKDIPVYNPDVRVFEVFDKDGSSLALFYADYFARPSKSGGAWMDSFVDQNSLTGTKPVVYNVCNFQKPAAGQPALLNSDDVTTMFHEFGHALHGMFSKAKYPTFSGTNVPRDFVEFPSQFNEHWAYDPTVFANYAKHYQTGQPMPKELVEKIRRARTFNQGYNTTEYVAASLLDLAWHELPAGASLQSVAPFEADALKKYGVNLPEVPPRYHSTYFSHIWGGGYSAGYYAYLWSEVLDHDAFYWFKEHGGMTRENGQRFRDMVLSRGSTQDVASLFKAFRGRDPIVEPLLIERGLKEPNK